MFLVKYPFLRSQIITNSYFDSPFVQRVWISLEAKQLSYQYIELDPYKKPDWYLKLNPRGLIPTLQHDDWCCGESTVLMEYVSFFGLCDGHSGTNVEIRS
jgi:glutathione S-transferase